MPKSGQARVGNLKVAVFLHLFNGTILKHSLLYNLSILEQIIPKDPILPQQSQMKKAKKYFLISMENLGFDGGRNLRLPRQSFGEKGNI